MQNKENFLKLFQDELIITSSLCFSELAYDINRLYVY